jgi:hypothetical protein
MFFKMLSGEVHTISIWNGFTVSDLCLKIVKDILKVYLCDVELNFFDKNFNRIYYEDYDDEIVDGDLFYLLVKSLGVKRNYFVSIILENFLGLIKIFYTHSV